jgi:hypothetical protein
VPRVEAEAVPDDEGTPHIRLLISGIEGDARGSADDGQSLTLHLSIKEAVAARDALNRALNDLGLPDLG